jgi:hypothetical protein
MESQEAATHEEIWDDSMLIESWNQALEEYKVCRFACCFVAAGDSQDTEIP